MDQTLCREQFTERLRCLYYKSIKRILIDLYARSTVAAAEMIDKGKDTNTYRVFQNKLEALPRANAIEIKKMYDIVERKAGSPELLSNLVHNVFTLNLLALIPDFSETLVLPGDRTIFHRILAEVAEEIFPMPYIFDVSQAAHDTRIESDNKIKTIIYNSINAQIIQILLEIITPYQARQKLLAAQKEEEKQKDQDQETESVFDTKKIDGVEESEEDYYESDEEETNVSVKLEQGPEIQEPQQPQGVFGQPLQQEPQQPQGVFGQPLQQEPQQPQGVFGQQLQQETEPVKQAVEMTPETQDMAFKLENFLLGPKSESNVKDDKSDIITIKV